MLLDPISYKDTIKNFRLEDLLEEEKMLIKEIKRYEKNKRELNQVLMHPSPKLIYEMNKEYLEVVREMILDRIDYQKEKSRTQ